MLDQQTQIDPQEGDDHFGLDEMVFAHEQEQALGQDQDTVSDDGVEDAVPSKLLWDDIIFLDYAISMINLLIPQTAAARSDRHYISSTKTFPSPIQQNHAGAAVSGQYGAHLPPSPVLTQCMTSLPVAHSEHQQNILQTRYLCVIVSHSKAPGRT